MIGEEWKDWRFSRVIKFYIYTIIIIHLLFHLSAPATFRMDLGCPNRVILMGI